MEVIGHVLASGILPSVEEPIKPVGSFLSPGVGVDAVVVPIG